MKIGIHMLLLMVCFLFSGMTVAASDPVTPEIKCPPGVEQVQDSSGICTDPGIIVTPPAAEGSLPLLFPLQSTQKREEESLPTTAETSGKPKDSNKKTIVYFFWGKGCPHCEEEQHFLEGLKRAQPSLEIRDYEVWYNRQNAGKMAAMLRVYGVQSSGVPVTIVQDRVFSGFTAQTRASIEKRINECRIVSCGDPAERLSRTDHSGPAARPLPFVSRTSAKAGEVGTDTSVTIPLLGALDARNASLPVITLVIAGMDSFNPCAFFVLLSLLGLLAHARSRNKMFLIGGIFVFFSGFIYFLFMAAWLNLFLIMGHVAVITVIAGCVSVVIAGINIKDFFLFKQGISLTIPDSARPKLFDRMRRLMRSTSLVSLMIGTTVLAVVANSYELLCTAGFPMVFTRILTLSNLSTATYYLYLVLYNTIYVIPLFIIVLGFTLTLGKRQLSEWQGRVLKLVSGVMMLGLGGVLLVNPALLNSVGVSFIILASALGVSLLVATVTRKLGR
jgi:thiol-disulfide isomerase/thioredoxin